jgi:hypothetical protein
VDTSFANSLSRCVYALQLHLHLCLRQRLLQRLEGQPALPVRDLEAETANKDEDKDDDCDAEGDEEVDEDEDADADADGEEPEDEA